VDERARRILVVKRDIPNLIRLLEDQTQHLSGPALAGVLVHLARLHLAQRNLDEARRTYEQAIEQTPDDAILLREYKPALTASGGSARPAAPG
jgi:tetratricopeptide (TPR) repeat protein